MIAAPTRTPMGRNIIFLDIDGVLNNLTVFQRQHSLPSSQSRIVRAFDLCSVGQLRRLLHEAHASIVVSSSWGAIAIPYLRQVGIPSRFILGITPNLWRSRGLEIQAWLNAHCGSVRSFVILDDDADMLHLRSRLVQTTFWTGLQACHVQRALRVLQ